jgi:hypothetical protein
LLKAVGGEHGDAQPSERVRGAGQLKVGHRRLLS